tara:strand:- start:5146 stop:5601 length:456 start_codon:yes stop_codon:yes gene_type:complete
MALKSDRYELQTDISFFYNAAATTRGCVVAHAATTDPTGGGMDQGVNLCAKSTSAVPVGILLNDVVDKDLTRTHLNQYKDEVQKGGKVTVLRKGYVVTNDITNKADVDAGDPAYACEDTAGNVATSGTYQIGRFLTATDADDYAKVEVNLP